MITLFQFFSFSHRLFQSQWAPLLEVFVICLSNYFFSCDYCFDCLGPWAWNSLMALFPSDKYFLSWLMLNDWFSKVLAFCSLLTHQSFRSIQWSQDSYWSTLMSWNPLLPLRDLNPSWSFFSYFRNLYTPNPWIGCFFFSLTSVEFLYSTFSFCPQTASWSLCKLQKAMARIALSKCIGQSKF